jgi:hypothetical protein
MQDEKSTNEEQEITLEQLDDVNGGANANKLSAALAFDKQRLAPRDLGSLSSAIGKLKDPGMLFRPGRPRLMEALPADLITMVERL